MANGEYGSGTIAQLYRVFGIGSIRPEAGGREVLFTPNTVRGGERAFQELREGDRVSFRLFPGQIAGMTFAEDVIPG